MNFATVDAEGNFTGTLSCPPGKEGINDRPGQRLVATMPPDLLHTWDGTAWQPPVSEVLLNEAKTARLEELSRFAPAKLELWANGNLQVDDTSTGRLTSWAAQALVCKATGAQFDLGYWIMADNSHRLFSDADDFLSFASAAAAYKTAAVLRNSALKAAIASAGDIAALNVIDITSDWPQ